MGVILGFLTREMYSRIMCVLQKKFVLKTSKTRIVQGMIWIPIIEMDSVWRKPVLYVGCTLVWVHSSGLGRIGRLGVLITLSGKLQNMMIRFTCERSES